MALQFVIYLYVILFLQKIYLIPRTIDSLQSELKV